MDRSELRRLMGPTTWDVLEPYMPDSLIDYYGTLCTVLFYGDNPGEQANVNTGSKPGAWFFRDVRLYPIKVITDTFLHATAKAVHRWNKARILSQATEAVSGQPREGPGSGYKRPKEAG